MPDCARVADVSRVVIVQVCRRVVRRNRLERRQRLPLRHRRCDGWASRGRLNEQGYEQLDETALDRGVTKCDRMERLRDGSLHSQLQDLERRALLGAL